MNQPVLIALALLTIPFAGCKKAAPAAAPNAAVAAADQTSASEPTAAQDVGNVPTAPAAPAQAPLNTVQPVNGVGDPRLTSQLRIFIRERGRLPESFAEFAGARLDSVPRLAPGLTFVIDPSTQEVKITTK